MVFTRSDPLDSQLPERSAKYGGGSLHDLAGYSKFVSQLRMEIHMRRIGLYRLNKSMQNSLQSFHACV